MTLSPAFTRLPRFDSPLAMIQAPAGDDGWYLVERAGRVLRFENSGAASTVQTVLDLRARVDSSAPEGGLLGIAFHPDFGGPGEAHDDEIFLSYTASGSPLQSRISRFRSADPSRIDPASETILLRVAQDFGNHNGGHIAFDGNGYLLAGFGDGGSARDPLDRAQDTGNLLGALIRIDVDGGIPYAIPADNPLAGGPICDLDGFSPAAAPAECPEIYAWGLRNPWRWSIDDSNGSIWLGDVGQNAREEINRIEGGSNYGWPIREGTTCHDPPSGCETAGLVDPVIDYEHSVGRSVTGGFVYRGTRLSGYHGVYFFADFVSGRIWVLGNDSLGRATPVLLLESGLAISSFARDRDGELYVLDYVGGRIHQLVAEPVSAGCQAGVD